MQRAAKKHSPWLSVVGRSCLDGTNTLYLASLSIMAVAQCPSALASFMVWTSRIRDTEDITGTAFFPMPFFFFPPRADKGLCVGLSTFSSGP